MASSGPASPARARSRTRFPPSCWAISTTTAWKPTISRPSTNASLEVVFHNRICGSLATKLGVEDGMKPENTILDLCYNNDELGDPLINRDQAVALNLATYPELDLMYDIVRRSGKLLTDLLHKAGIELVDAKFEFGRAADTGAIIISDELSPDTCRMWDEETGERLDKDRFRLDLGDMVASYGIVLEKLKNVMETEE